MKLVQKQQRVTQRLLKCTFWNLNGFEQVIFSSFFNLFVRLMFYCFFSLVKTSAEKQFLLQNASSLLQNLNLIQPLDENTWTLLVDVGQISSWRLHVGMGLLLQL